MEILELNGYTDEEKLAIAHRFLIPKQIEAHGLANEPLEWTDEGLTFLIRNYTREAGVRNLEREIATVARKIATRKAEGREYSQTVGPEEVRDYLAGRDTSTRNGRSAQSKPAWRSGSGSRELAATSCSSRRRACRAKAH